MATKDPPFIRIFDELDTIVQHQNQDPVVDNLSHSSGHSLSRSSSPQIKNRYAQLREIEQLEHSDKYRKSDAIHLLREKEAEIQTLLEEMAVNQSRCLETQDALSEAQTIIEQLQDQLSELRLRAAQSASDADTFRLKNLFLSKQGETPKSNEQYLYEICEQLQNEIQDLKTQLSESGRAHIRLQNENEYLKRQLQSSNHSRSPSSSPNSSTSSPLSRQSHTQHLKTEQLQQHYEELQRRLVYVDSQHRDEIEKYEQELANLSAEIDSLRQKEREWNDAHIKLLEQQEELEYEHKEQTKKLESMLRAQSVTPIRSISAMGLSENAKDVDFKRLQRVTEERNHWKNYANGLVRSMVQHCKDIFDNSNHKTTEFSTEGERYWHNYAMHLLEILIEVAPERLATEDVQLLQGKKKIDRTVQNASTKSNNVISEPDMLSAVNMRITKPSKLTTSERVARLASRPVFRPSMQ